MNIKIPGYEITGTIGKGGMAEVFLARQETLHREIALKVLFPSMADDPQFGDRFIRETKIIAGLPHPNIVPVYDAGIVGKHYYLAMEYLKGGCLSDRMKTGISLEEAVQYTLDIAEALSFAHTQGFIHRDIKPDNVLFRTQAKNAVLSDFGIARSTATDNSLTQINLIIGTPKYMSPQQALGETLNEQSDIFSLGIILFEMLCGHPPYDAESIGQLCIQHRTNELRTLPPGMHILQPIMNKLLAFNLRDRYPNAKALITELKQAQQTLTMIGTNNDNENSTDIIQKPTKHDSETQSLSAHLRKPHLWVALGTLILILEGSIFYYFSHTPSPQDNAIAIQTENSISNPITQQETPKKKSPLPLAITVNPQHARIEIQSNSGYTTYQNNDLLPGELILKISAIGYVSQTTRHLHPNDYPLEVQLELVETVSPQELLMYQKAVESKASQLIDKFKSLYPNSPFIYVIDYSNNQQSMESIRELAESGDIVARASLAEIFDSPEINNKTDALHWSALAAQAHFPLGQTQYALMLLNGRNPAGEKINLAIQLLQQASDSGFYLAKSSLAEFYLLGKYVKKDLSYGVQLLKEAAELNDPYSNNTLARIYDAGYGNIAADIRLSKLYKEESDRLNRENAF